MKYAFNGRNGRAWSSREVEDGDCVAVGPGGNVRERGEDVAYRETSPESKQMEVMYCRCRCRASRACTGEREELSDAPDDGEHTSGCQGARGGVV